MTTLRAATTDLVDDVVGAACWGAAPHRLAELAHERTEIVEAAIWRAERLSPIRLGGRPHGVVVQDLRRAIALCRPHR